MSLFRLWDRCGESCSTGSSLPLDCDPAYAPPSSAAAAAAALGSAPTDEAGRRSDSLPLEARPGGSLTGQASMCSQTSQPIMPPKPPPSSFATIASRLAPQDSVDKSPRLSLSSVKSQHSKELPVKARVCCRKLKDNIQVWTGQSTLNSENLKPVEISKKPSCKNGSPINNVFYPIPQLFKF